MEQKDFEVLGLLSFLFQIRGKLLEGGKTLIVENPEILLRWPTVAGSFRDEVYEVIGVASTWLSSLVKSKRQAMLSSGSRSSRRVSRGHAICETKI